MGGVLIGTGVFLLVGAAAAFFFASMTRKKGAALAGTETSTVADLTTLAAASAESVGAGHFSLLCEVKGTAQPCDGGVLTAPFSKQPAVWYRTRTTHDYWAEVSTTDSEGRHHTKREKRTETVSDEQFGAFAVDDGTGQVRIEMGKDGIEGLKDTSFDRFEPADTGHRDTTATIAGITINLGDDDDDRDRRDDRDYRGRGDHESIGFRREEWMLRPGVKLYVLGQATDRGGVLEIGEPEKGRFIVSVRTEEELRTSTLKQEKIAVTAMQVAAPLGAVLIVAGLVALVV